MLKGIHPLLHADLLHALASMGHGDELVIDSNGFNGKGWLDINGSPLTEVGKITERFRRPTFGRATRWASSADETAG